MCSPSVTHRYVDGNPPLVDDQDDAVPIDGWPAVEGACAVSGSEVRADNRAARRRLARQSIVPGFAPGLDRMRGILDSSLFKSAKANSRQNCRTPGLTLTDAERDSCRSMLGTVAGCGSRWAAFTRRETRDAGEIEYRLSCQMKCGTRLCPECDAEIRRREVSRVLGDWRLFITLGVPARSLEKGDAWRKMPGWIRSFTNRLRKLGARDTAGKISFPAEAYDAAALANCDIEPGSRLRPVLEYAWVLEPHKSGFPHVHMVLNCSWLEYSWLLKAWKSSTGLDVKWVFGRKVTSTDGVCRYLAKYLSKTSFPADLCSIMFKKRMWASTRQAPEKPEPRWERESETRDGQAYSEAMNAETYGKLNGWTLEMAKRGGYAVWSRPVDISRDYEKTSVIISKDLETSKCSLEWQTFDEAELDRIEEELFWHDSFIRKLGARFSFT